MRLLIVDWDYFLLNPQGSPEKPEAWGLYDWSCKEAPFFIDNVWTSRAMAFEVNQLPYPDTTGEEVGFWGRVKLAKGARLFYAESNASAVNPEVVEGIEAATLLDAHHDHGYTGKEYTFTELKKMAKVGRWTCEDWAAFYFVTGRSVEVLYPRWKSWAFHLEQEPSLRLDNRRFDGGGPLGTFDRVFVCRSGAWVPPWLDGKYQQFLEDCPVPRSRWVKLDSHEVIRSWDAELPRRWAEFIKLGIPAV